MNTPNLTAERLREVVDFDPSTGVFVRKARLANRHQVGDRADTAIGVGKMAGYRRVSLFSMRYLAHRLAWLYVYGDWPPSDIDHINGDKGDNRICNLRAGANCINAQNKRRARVDSHTGVQGIQWHAQNRKWRARLWVNGRQTHLGLFNTREDAHRAYLEAKRKFHEGCTL